MLNVEDVKETSIVTVGVEGKMTAVVKWNYGAVGREEVKEFVWRITNLKATGSDRCS